VALTEGRARLADDHRRARALVEGLAVIPGIVARPEDVVTNMVYVRVGLPGRSDDDLVAFLATRGVRVYPPLPDGVRFVTSLEVDDDDVAAALAAVREFAGA
jgi:threonine aldolase